MLPTRQIVNTGIFCFRRVLDYTMNLLSDHLVSVRGRSRDRRRCSAHQPGAPDLQKRDWNKAQGQAVRALQGDKNPSRTCLTKDTLLTHLGWTNTLGCIQVSSIWRREWWDIGTLLKIPPQRILWPPVVLADYGLSTGNAEAGRLTFENAMSAFGHGEGEDGKRETV